MSDIVIPETLPYGFRRLEWAYRRQRWRRMVQVALLIAKTGVSTAIDIMRLMELDKKSTHIVLNSMLDLLDPLIESRLLFAGGKGRLRVVTLTDYGKDLCRALGGRAGRERLGENRPPAQRGGTGRTCRTGY